MMANKTSNKNRKKKNPFKAVERYGWLIFKVRERYG